ncbi:SDR family oxidoreductase [Roseomonas sp. KE2513]|uniref:SDR family oxidoreductase n=1 Tax=Roseomonas sp. KE2513 TaxID=2479202 RepID=UPI0018DFE2E8|nr:SDR family oxidoreductase [Roseomonas sp. KE2513]MBI0536373.1 SDR family oxidoreductase [Roseomonas sp. KE2513]
MDQTNDSAPSRRQMMGGVTAGAAMAVASNALAQGTTQGAQPTSPLPLAVPRDPRDEYPRPPFARQTQAAPGLAGQMNPRPDHGETSYRGTGRLAGRKALITGGDSGIGRAAAIAYAREGADVAIGYLPQEQSDADEVLEIIRQAGRKAVALPGDIRDEAFCNQMVETAVREMGGLDILVNNAGKQQAQKSITDITTEQFDATFKTNVYAPFWITRAAVPHLKPGAAIIITASEQAYDPSAILFDYAQTKACGVSFAKSLSKQLAEKGIRVNAVAPGPYWTALQPSGGALPEALEQFGAKTSLGRPGQPVEIAPVYVLLASQESSFTTGQVFGASGGGGFP